MKRLTINCVVCIMFGIVNKNYVIRPDSNSYLGQQYLIKLENMKVGYWAMFKICKRGVENMFPYFR